MTLISLQAILVVYLINHRLGMRNHYVKKVLFSFYLGLVTTTTWAKAIIDPDVQAMVSMTTSAEPRLKQTTATTATLPLLVFLRSMDEQDQFIADFSHIAGIKIQKIASAPAVLVMIPARDASLERIANHRAVTQISTYQSAHEELENSEQAILLRASTIYPNVQNWWSSGDKGLHGVVGLIDSGVATEHPSLQGKTILIRKELDSGYDHYKNGVRSAHGTGVACIYMGTGSAAFPNDQGIAPDAITMVAGLAGEGDGHFEDLSQTFSTLDWILLRSGVKPNVINYSYGNGSSTCKTCSDWSGLARVTDYIVNQDKILWVKSAGNTGMQGGMTTPADNYNGLTIANMNPARLENGQWILSPDRSKHSIRYTSSRGPTLEGRKKPDLAAPGNDTRTCAPDPLSYPIKYTVSMDYRDGYRLMGGTSSATPHVGAAVLLLQEAGITDPMAQKALLINSADAWFDDGKPGPDDPIQPNLNGHYQIQGSLWNRTYGWGYLNMQSAYEQRKNIVMGTLTTADPEQSFQVELPIGGKITLVHERRVGYSLDYTPWALSALSLQIVDAKTGEVIDEDNSAIDTVHQVANCQRKLGEKNCATTTPSVRAIVKVKLLSKTIDGASNEPFALVMSVPPKI